MYAKLVKVISAGRPIVYLRLLEKVNVNGIWKEKMLCNLGRQDVAGRKALGDLLKRLRKFTDEVLVTPEEIKSHSAKDYGAALVGQKLWEEIGLEKWVKQVCGKESLGSLGEAGVLAMVLNRLVLPRSKLNLYEWMPTVYLPKWQSKRFKLPVRADIFAERFYRTMDWLIKGKNKEKIEEKIISWAIKLFPIDVVFYDLTNIQFEGWEKLKQARYGYIRLGKKNHKQILLGLVMVEGLPVSCHLFRGNRAEKTTLLWVKNKVKKQFNVGRIIFVCDRGMISEENLTQIESEKDGYIVALKRRRLEEVELFLQEPLSSFVPIQRNERGEVILYAWEAPKEEGKRLIVAFNPLKAAAEKAKREAIIRELEEELKELKSKVSSGKTKKAQTIVASCERILSHKHGKRYFTYGVLRNGHFEFKANEKGRTFEENLDGKFVIKTTEHNPSLPQVVFKYKDLMDIEDGFRDLKDFIKVAPVFHWKYRRVKAHIFICILALLLERYMEQKLKRQKLQLSARTALSKLQNIKVVENQVGGLVLKYITPPNQELKKILAACGIFKLPKMLPDFQRVKKEA